MESPVTVFETALGRGLKASHNLPRGTVVTRFEGPIMHWEEVPEAEIRHALLLEDGRWMIDRGLARLLNHSCEPNCRIDAENNVVTQRPVRQGEELTFAYNIVYDGEDPGSWDPRWSFACACGTSKCHGRVDCYVTPDGEPWRKG